MTAKKSFIYVLIAYVIFIFIQSLFFKFTGSEETDIIFSTVAEWMNTVGLSAIAPTFESIGGYVIGVVELLAATLLVIPTTRKLGALLGLGVISGAIFFHLATPLGIDRVVNATGDTDGGVLFYMACGVWISCLLIFIFNNNNSMRD